MMQVTVIWTFCLNSLFPLYFLSMCLCSCPFVQTFLSWKGSKYYKIWDFVCSLSYQTCNAHAPYCHMRPVRRYRILPRYVLNGRIFEDKLMKVVMCFDFLHHVCLKYFWFSRIEWDNDKNIYWCSCKYAFLFLVRCEWNLNFIDRFSNNIQK